MENTSTERLNDTDLLDLSFTKTIFFLPFTYIDCKIVY